MQYPCPQADSFKTAPLIPNAINKGPVDLV
jgi:hypothetical protein